jgi:hypothetical protein
MAAQGRVGKTVYMANPADHRRSGRALTRPNDGNGEWDASMIFPIRLNDNGGFYVIRVQDRASAAKC